jgi:hypothetical protein
MQQSKLLCPKLSNDKRDSGDIAVETGDEAELNRVAAAYEDDRDRRSRRLGHARRWPAAGDSDHRHWTANQIGNQCRQAIVLALQPVVLNSDVLSFDVTEFLETFTERGHITRSDFRSPRVKQLDHRRRLLLRARRERPGRRAAKQRDEPAPVLIELQDIKLSGVSQEVTKRFYNLVSRWLGRCDRRHVSSPRAGCAAAAAG